MASDALTRGALPRVQWGPVIAGVLCALAAHIVLGLFGAAFGFASRPTDSTGIAVLAGIWGVLTPIVASFVGAWVAVRVAGDREEPGAFLHGAIVWCIALIAGAIFITGTLASGAMTTGTALSGNIGAQGLAPRDTPQNRARASQTADDAAKGAAAGTGVAGVAALLGLAGAVAGAEVGRRTVRGEGLRRGHRRADGMRREYPASETGVAYTDRSGMVTTRPPDVVERRDDPNLHH